jgi:5-methyltetrahydropteroyltriglutamate--homocysteine methyltransferase
LTEIKLSLTGVHARNEATIQATQDWERGRIDSVLLNAAFRDDVDHLVRLQTEVGADYLCDGQITTGWQDFLRPITTGFSGVKKGPMFRWYNTNTFYQVPEVVGPVSSEGLSIWRKIERRLVTHGRFRVTLPDPLTLSELADDHHYHDGEKVMFAFAEGLNAELRTLQAKGVKYVQLSSPALVARFRTKPLSSDHLKQAGEAVRTALKGVNIRTGFHTFFGDASPYLPALFDVIPTDDLGFDFTQTDPASLTRTKKGILAGITDARSTYLESAEELRERADHIVERTGTKELTLGASSDLRFIPRVSADEKLRRLGALKRALGGR